MKLFCVRHGEACTPEEDPNCPLTESGRKVIENLGRHLVSCGIEIPHIMHSTKMRAKQTAEILNSFLKSDIEECPSILDPDAPVQTIVDRIPSWEEDTMLVGHLPFMGKLVNALVIQDEYAVPIVNFSPGTMICLEYDEVNQWIIKWLLSPGIVAKK